MLSSKCEILRGSVIDNILFSKIGKFNEENLTHRLGEIIGKKAQPVIQRMGSDTTREFNESGHA